ncbi:MAG: penicillin acylase family protein [Chloroflexota bacterium]|nr:MAG: penicillin acylase family protein [Chloroflexota bacterium]
MNAPSPSRGARPPRRARLTGPVHRPVAVAWDTWGIPHIRGESERDTFVALGYAMAQERLWQLDFVRRQASGRVAAILGPGYLATDRAMRTLGLVRTAERDLRDVPSRVAEVLDAYAVGVNHWIATCRRLPIEFEALGYAPEPWHPRDSIAIWKYRWWYNSGRPEAIVLADLARRILPPELHAAYARAERGEETIVPDAGPSLASGGDSGQGSNNWVVGPTKTTTGRSMLCNDPHNPYRAPSQWFEAQISAPGLDAIGAFFQGVPTIYIGRNRDVAWGVTNHNSPARDLYRETLHPTDPDLYRVGDDWQPFERTLETIDVTGQPSETHAVRRTIRGPLVGPGNALLDDGLVKLADQPGTALSLAWVGNRRETGLDVGLALHDAGSVCEAIAALRRWPCPPLNFVCAGRDGDFAYHVAGHIPKRERGGQGIRDANDPADAWQGDYSYDDLPSERAPARGWIATANNPPWAARDPHYLGLASWAAGYRAQRIRERLEEKRRLTADEVAAIQSDIVSARARDLVGPLLRRLAGSDDRRVTSAARRLARWDFRLSRESIAASIFEAFWDAWSRAVAAQWFPEPVLSPAAVECGAVARGLILGEVIPWFGDRDIDGRMRAAFVAGLDRLTALAGPDSRKWRWGTLHTLTLHHPAEGRVPGVRLSTGPSPTSGGQAVRAAGHSDVGSFAVASGATYRFAVDFSESGARSTTDLGQSAHAGSRHYRDQHRLWLSDGYKPLWMDPADVAAHHAGTTSISPSGSRAV